MKAGKLADLPRPQVSVIISAYNAAAYVAEAVSSALASSDVTLEVLVVDDGSTDGTWDVLGTFGDRIRRMRQDNGGPYKARNLAARLARGEWLAFLDADDVWTPDKLQRQLALADESIGLVFTDCSNFGTVERVKPRQSDNTQFFDGDVFEPLLLNNFISLSSVLMRQSWFVQLGGFSEAHTGVQDWDLWLRFASAGGLVALVREPLTRYRLHAGQMTNRIGVRAKERVAVIDRALSSPRGQRVSRAIARQARANVWAIGAWIAAPTDRLTAIAWFVRAARIWPWNVAFYKGVLKCCLNRV
jgi:glycosyltransferase involved in cell wall biosynthesis